MEVSNRHQLKLIASDFLGEQIESAGVFGLQDAYMPMVGGSSMPDMPIIPAANPSLRELAEAEKGRISRGAEIRSRDLAVRLLVAVSAHDIFVLLLEPELDAPRKQLMVFPRSQTQAELLDLGGRVEINLKAGSQEIGMNCSLAPFSRYAGGSKAVIQSLSA